jgi:hypothetical protein
MIYTNLLGKRVWSLSSEVPYFRQDYKLQARLSRRMNAISGLQKITGIATSVSYKLLKDHALLFWPLRVTQYHSVAPAVGEIVYFFRQKKHCVLA